MRASGAPTALRTADATPFDGLKIDDTVPWDAFLADTDTMAFIAMRGDTILYEGDHPREEFSGRSRR